MSGLDHCYRLLGLEPDARDEDIRRDYKSLVLRYHPDRGEGSDAARFREIQEAYKALTDDYKREEYLRAAERSAQTGGIHPRPATQAGSFNGPGDDVGDLFRDLFGWREPRLNLGPGGKLEILLTPQEAQRGVRIPLQVPVAYPCRECGGSGGYLFFICPGCGGLGMQQASKRVTLTVPANSAGYRAREIFLDEGLKVIVRVERET